MCVITLLLSCSSVSAQDKIILVCVSDARNESALGNAEVNLITDVLTISGTTSSGGCVYLSGQIPVSDEEEVDIKLGLSAGSPYPNPASNQLFIPVYSDRAMAAKLKVFDVQGRQMPVHTRSSGSGSVHQFDVDLSLLADGLYFYQVAGDAGRVTGKFIKRVSGHSATGFAQPAYSADVSSEIHSPELLRVDSVTIEVARNGFVSTSEKRILSNFETLTYSLYKSTEQKIPLMDMFGVQYLGLFKGGLYLDQSDEMPQPHLEAGLSRAASIEPLDVAGNPDPNGKIVFTSIGMSTTSSIFCGVADSSEPCKEGTFIRVLKADPQINTHLEVIDGADPGKTADKWETPEMKAFDRVFEEELEPFGLSEAQVQAAWVNLASSMPTSFLPAQDADAYLLERQYGNVLRSLAARYPNLKLVFFASRVYAGYATSDINPEPFAYESGFAVKWVIEAQLKQMHETGAPVDMEAGNLNYNTSAPWIAWGPYLWADGANPRSDGLVWLPEDLKEDGTHLNRAGIEKITPILLDFFKTSSLSRCWFLENGDACE